MQPAPPNFQEAFRVLAETASDAIITIDERSIIVFVNAAAVRIFGYSIPEMVGQPMTMLMPEYLRHMHERGLRRYLDTGQRHIPWEAVELPGLHKDGRIVPLEISFGEFAVDDGRRLFTGIARDVTQRTHQQRLRSAYMAAVRILVEHPSSEFVLPQTLRAICGALQWKVGILWNVEAGTETLRLATSWCEDDDLSEFVRQSAGFNFTKGIGLPGRVWATKQPAWILRIRDDSNFPRGAIATRFGLLSGAAFPIIAHQEVLAVMEFFSTEIEPPDVELLDTFMTIGHQMGHYIERTNAGNALARSELELRRLVTSEKQARQQAEAANRMKDEFLAILSHELRTPLTSVFGWIQLLQSGGTDPATTAKALSVIDRNIRIQAQLIDDLLSVSQIMTGKLPIRREMIDPLRVIKATVESVRPSADAQQIILQLESDPHIPALSADPARLQQVLWNLLTNAVKFTPKQGLIVLTVKCIRSQLHITVSDTGSGISSEFLPRVFNRFSQADASTTRRHGGLGLGLALVRQLVELHGGTVQVRSAGIGKGSTFTVTFPLLEIPGKHPEPEVLVERQTGDALRGVKVLLIEDEPDTREMIAATLQQFGASVTQVPSAAEALREFVTSTPDILISDIGMPEMDGYELLAAIRQQTLHPPPAVALTAYTTPSERDRALGAGFQAHISKPVKLSELVSITARLVGRAS